MRYRTAELLGALLDAAVAKAEGMSGRIVDGAERSYFEADERDGIVDEFEPSRYWTDGGPIIDCERVAFRIGKDEIVADIMNDRGVFIGVGLTHLIAAMRAYCASKFGEEVEL